MNLLPPPGPQRNRLLMMIFALALLGAAYLKWGGSEELVIPTSTGPQPSVVPTRPQPRASGTTVRRATATAPGVDATMPQALKLAEMEQVPEEPKVGRNPFRYGVPPPPPAPAYVPPPPPPPAPPPVPQGPPPIPLKLTMVVTDSAGRLRAYLTDPKTGFTIEGLEGQIIDGRYRLLKVGTQSVVMSYLDGTGQRTINVGG